MIVRMFTWVRDHRYGYGQNVMGATFWLVKTQTLVDMTAHDLRTTPQQHSTNTNPTYNFLETLQPLI